VYIWVGRFAREQGAQNVAGRLENKGLPVVVLPRRNQQNGQQFFVVFSGPYPRQRANTVVQWFRNSGLFSAHEVRPPAANQNPRGKQKQRPYQNQ